MADPTTIFPKVIEHTDPKTGAATGERTFIYTPAEQLALDTNGVTDNKALSVGIQRLIDAAVAEALADTAKKATPKAPKAPKAPRKPKKKAK